MRRDAARAGSPSRKADSAVPAASSATADGAEARVLERCPVPPVVETPVRTGSVQKGGATLLPRLPMMVLALALVAGATTGTVESAFLGVHPARAASRRMTSPRAPAVTCRFRRLAAGHDSRERRAALRGAQARRTSAESGRGWYTGRSRGRVRSEPRAASRMRVRAIAM